MLNTGMPDWNMVRRPAVLIGLMAVLAGSSSARSVVIVADGVPPEVLLACGHPGAQARVLRAALSPLHIRHRDCDLRGVVLAGVTTSVTVPARPGGVQATSTGPGFEETVTVRVARRTLDVTVDVTVAP